MWFPIVGECLRTEPAAIRSGKKPQLRANIAVESFAPSRRRREAAAFVTARSKKVDWILPCGLVASDPLHSPLATE
jgi:hypothetical protein